MSLAYECDICGKLFKPEVNHLNEVILSYQHIVTGNTYRKYTMTSCPSCMSYIVKFMNYNRKNSNADEIKNYEMIKETFKNETNN